MSITKERVNSDIEKYASENNKSVKDSVDYLCGLASDATAEEYKEFPKIVLAWQVLQLQQGTGEKFPTYNVDYYHYRETIRSLVNSYYDIQKLRIASGNRLYAVFSGVLPNASFNDILKIVTTEHAIISNENIKKVNFHLMNSFGTITAIRSLTDFNLVNTYMGLCDMEYSIEDSIKTTVKEHTLYDTFFKNVLGCGPIMSAVCLAYFDIYRSKYVSSMWRYAGLDVIQVAKEDGTIKGKGNGKWYTEDREYVNKDNVTASKKSLTFNPFLRTKLIGVLGAGLLKAGLRTAKDENGNPILDENGNKIQTAKSKYVECYLDYLNRLNQRKDLESESASHRNNMAMRYMIKQFIRDLYVEWRTVEKLPIYAPYEVAKLGNKPHKYNEDHYAKSVSEQFS